MSFFIKDSDIYFLIEFIISVFVTPKGDHLLSQRYSELYLNTPSKPLR